jgi:hypothetical protein
MTENATLLPLRMPDMPEANDHRIALRATVPAVELLDVLAQRLEPSPWAAVLTTPLVLSDVRFEKFLLVDDIPRCDFVLAVEAPSTGDGLCVTLSSQLVSRNGMRRSRQHLAVRFGGTPSLGTPPADPMPDCTVLATRVYDELIRFGPRLRNLCGEIALGSSGARGIVRSPPDHARRASTIGGPYLFDSAMHLACVWGQRYAGYVAYPTGFASRTILSPLFQGTRACLMVPGLVEERRFTCDIWLLDEAGRACDVTVGLVMAPMASGLPPPAWIVRSSGEAS